MKIRIGNDFKTKWAITWLGEPEDFSDATDIALSFNIYDKKIELSKDVDYTITDNIIEIDCTPDICDILGTYNLELHYTKPNDDFIDGERRSAVDIDAFRIVGKSEKADSTQDVSIISDAVAIFLDIAYKKLEEIEANEDVRIANEGEREDAESIRASNEDIRISNEQDRQINTATAISNAEQATLNANNSAVYANEQGSYAEEMSSHPPTIINDYWHIWNLTTNQYESTGQYARGDSAVEGALVVQTTGQSAVNTMSQKAVTDELAQLAGDVSLKVRNLITNGDFVNDVNGWSVIGTSVEHDNGRLRAYDWTTSFNKIISPAMEDLSIGDLLYLRIGEYERSAIPATNNLINIRINDTNPSIIYEANNPNLIIKNLSGIAAYNGETPQIHIRTYQGEANSVWIDDVVCINLTKSFGVGNEPTKEQMDALMDIVGYFDGDTISLNQLMRWLLESQQQSEDKIYEKANHGYASFEEAKTLKEVDDKIADVESDVEQLAYVKIKNEIVNGNFENGLIAPFFKNDGGGGKSTIAINSSTPISGNYDIRLTIITPSTAGRPSLYGLHTAGNIGDKIYLHFYAKILSGTPMIGLIHNGESANSIYGGDVINGRNTRIIDVKGTDGNLGLIYFNSPSAWDMQMDNFMRINLTETFGVGNEPTKEQMDALMDIVGYFDGEIIIPAQKLMQWQLKLIRIQTLENIEALNIIFKGGQLEMKSLIADTENQKSRWIELKDNYDFPSKGIFIGRQNEDVVISINGVTTKLNL